MSFNLTVWAQPVNTPLPTTVMQAHAQMEQMQDAEGEHVESRFLTLARELEAHFPRTEDGEDDMYDHSLSILEQNPDKDQTYHIGLLPRDDRFDLGYKHLLTQAKRLGLHVMDEQNGLVYLASGQVLKLSDTVAVQAAPSTMQPRVATQFIDARTREYAKILVLNPSLIARAEAGHADSQLALALHFIEAKNLPTRTQVELVMLWLERAVAQGQSAAQAALGEALLRGWGGIEVNVQRGLALLETSVAANEPDGCYHLATYLYAQSVQYSKGQEPVLRTDAASQQNIQRVPQLLVRAAAYDHARAIFWLAIRIWDERGTPRDDVGAKALMQLARTRTPELMVQNREVLTLMQPTPADSAEVMALAKHWGANLAQLPTFLAQRHARITAENQRARADRKLRETDQETEGSLSESSSNYSFPPWHIGKTTLVIGAVWLLLVLMMFRTLGPTGFKVTALLLGAVGAFGVWRTSEDFDWNGALRFLLAALALVPGLAIFVCIGVLWRSMK